MPKKNSAKMVELAKQMYLRYEPWSKIIEKTGLSRHSINQYATNKWREERDAQRSDIIEAMTESKRGILLSINKHGLEIVDKAIQQLKDDVVSGAKKLSVMEIDKVQSIITNFDKIVKLDDGEATERHEVIKPASIEELQKVLNDPFIEPVEYKEINDEDTNSGNVNHISQFDGSDKEGS